MKKPKRRTKAKDWKTISYTLGKLWAVARAAREAQNILGTGDCVANTCDGCEFERHEALDLLRRPLAALYPKGPYEKEK